MQDLLGGEAGVRPEWNLGRQSDQRVADVFIDALARNGVDTVFGLPGGTIAPLNDALLSRPEIRVITNRHEASSVFAAAGYARTSGKLGVVLVTSGPGVLNTVTGAASAYCDGLPVLILVGEVPRSVQGKGALQEGSAHHLNVVAMMSHVTKLAAEIPDANAALPMLQRAIATAMSGKPGPVVLTLPLDITTASIRPPRVELRVSTQFDLRPRALDPIANLIAQSRKTVIFAGAGVRNGMGAQALLEFAEHTQIPVMTTPKGKGVFPDDHPLSLGVFGLGGHPSAKQYLGDGIDVMLAVGTSLGDLATDSWSKLLKPARALVHVDIEAGSVGRNYSTDISVVGRVDDVLSALKRHLSRARKTQRFGPSYHTSAETAGNGPNGRIAPQRAIWEIQQVLPQDTIYAIDSGEHFLFATHYLRINHPDSFIAMTGLGSMGTSIGAAMGAKLAKPKRTAAVIIGDGGFAMVGSELGVAAQEGLPIVVFVFNDERLGMVEIGDASIFGRTRAWSISQDVPMFARAMGADCIVAERAGEIQKLAPPTDRPLVVDVRIDRDVRMPRTSRINALSANKKTELPN